MSEEIRDEVADGRAPDDAYVAWFAAESECEQALQAWFKALPAQQAEAYCAYRAALDREEAAADALKRLSELTQPCRYVATRTEQAGLR